MMDVSSLPNINLAVDGIPQQVNTGVVQVFVISGFHATKYNTIPISDFGINRLATLSNGERIANPKHGSKRRKELAHQQRHLARKTKGSARWEKQRRKVARVHAHIADARADHLHKVTTDLVRRFDLICIEDLNVRGLSKITAWPARFTMHLLAKRARC